MTSSIQSRNGDVVQAGSEMPVGSMEANQSYQPPGGDMPTGSMTSGLGQVVIGGDMPAGGMHDASPSAASVMSGGHMGVDESASTPDTLTPAAMAAPAAAPKSADKPHRISLEQLTTLTQEKDYVPTDTGLQKGSTGEAVSQLHQYLTRFGYLQSDILEDFGFDRSAAAAAPPESDERFDDNTAAALRQFQEFNGVDVTGTLNQSTVALMGRPRCGFPDALAADFVVQGSKWNKTNLTYAFNEFTPDLSQAAVRAAIQQAFGLWGAVTPLSFQEVAVNQAPDIVIRFVAANHGDGNNFDGASGVLAHAYYPPPGGGNLAGDTHFDEAEAWSVNLPPSGIDLVSVAAHEFGHALGLAHSNVQSALMYAYYGGAHRNLEPDDIAGIQQIYGRRTNWSNWESLGGGLTSDPAVSSWSSGRLDTFVRGGDNALWHKWYQNGWSNWESLGGFLTSSPAAASWSSGRIDTFVRGGDNALWHKWFQNGWSNWESLGGVLTSSPAVSSWAAGRLDVFVRGTDNALWHKWFQNGWSNWESLGGVLTSGPAAVSWSSGRIDVFVRGTDNALWHKWFQNGWSNWESLGGVLTSDPAVSSWAAGRLDVFVRGTDNALWHKWFQNGWSNWESLGGFLTSGPDAVSWGSSRIDTFVRGGDNAMWHKWYG